MKYLLRLLMIVGIPLLMFGKPDHRPPPHHRPHKTMQKFIQSLKEVGSNGIIDETLIEEIFTKNLKFIANDKVIINDRNEFSSYFQPLPRFDIQIHEKIFSKSKCVLSYDLTFEDGRRCHAIAIFKLRRGKIFEIHQIYHKK